MGILNANTTSFFALSRVDGDIVEKAGKMIRDGAVFEFDMGSEAVDYTKVK